MKHRTQILLEDRHYVFLKELALSERKSISAALRELLDEVRERREGKEPEGDPVLEIIGKFEGPHEHGGRNAEEILYGERR